MKKKEYTDGNIALRQAGKTPDSGWYLAVTSDNGGNMLAIEREEISRIVDVCLAMLVDHDPPPKGLRKSVG